MPAIRVGVLETSGSSGAAIFSGAEAAAQELNAAGGVDGQRLQLLKLAPPQPWRGGASLIARLTFEEGLVAVVGPTDEAAAHVAAQIATRRRIPVIVLSPEASLTRAMDPWVFRGVPDDAEQARALLRWTFSDPRGKRATVVVPAGRAGRGRLASLRRACRELGVTLAAVIRPGERPVVARPADVLLLWLDPSAALTFLKQAGAEYARKPLLGSTRLDDATFIDNAPPRANGLLLPLLRSVTPSESDRDAKTTRGTLAGASRQRPASAAKRLPFDLGYDMVRAIAAAAARKGSKPGQIRLALGDGYSLHGKSGVFHFDRHGNRRGPISIGVLRNGTLSR